MYNERFASIRDVYIEMALVNKYIQYFSLNV